MYKKEWTTLTHSCLAAFGVNSEGRIRSVQITRLTAQGKRALTFEGKKLNKLQYGIAKGSFVCLQEDSTSNRVFMAEGVETGLSLKEAGLKGTIVASLGIHNLGEYQGPEKEIILCGDNDDHKPHSKTHALLLKIQETFQAQGKTALIIKPTTPGDDFNDVLKKQGVEGVREYVKDYLDHDKQRHMPQLLQDVSSGKHTITDKGMLKIPSVEKSSSSSPQTSSRSDSFEVISEYIRSKIKTIKTFEGCSLGEDAKQELKSYLHTLQKNEPLFQAIKGHNPDLAQEFKQLLKEQERVKSRGMEM